MKKKDKYKLINHAFKEYEEIFKCKYERKYVSPKLAKRLLKQYTNSTLTRWDYCCYGLYENCWQELYERGNWDMTQRFINKYICSIFRFFAKSYRRDSRIGIYTDEDTVNILIVARDIDRSDYFITFRK